MGNHDHRSLVTLRVVLQPFDGWKIQWLVGSSSSNMSGSRSIILASRARIRQPPLNSERSFQIAVVKPNPPIPSPRFA